MNHVRQWAEVEVSLKITLIVQLNSIANMTGFNLTTIGHRPDTLRGRLQELHERYRVHVTVTIAVLTAITFIVAEAVPKVEEYVRSSAVIQYITLLVLLDLAACVYLRQSPPVTSLAKNQDESMHGLLEAVPRCRTDQVDLLEYAGQTVLPLIRAIQREGVPVRILVKHPETLDEPQKQRTIATLDTIIHSIFDNYQGRFEIRCYRMPFTVRGRRLGNEILELGWLTPDLKRKTAYGHGNPSLVADLSNKSNDHLLLFFERTFKDLWNSNDTEDGRTVLARVGPQTLDNRSS